MPPKRKKKGDEDDFGTLYETNVVPPVLKKKQAKAFVDRCRDEHFAYLNAAVNTDILVRPPLLRTDPPLKPVTPTRVFKTMFNPEMMNAWKNETNTFFREKGIKPMTKREVMLYLGIIIKMCLAPEDQQRNHWKGENRDERYPARHRFEQIHNNRFFSISEFFTHFNGRVHSAFSDLGSEICLDELQAAFAGHSPMINFNPSKPHHWGHLFNMLAIMIGGRPFVIAMIARHPGFKRGQPTTLDIVEYLDGCLPTQRDFHYTADCFYNTKAIREYLEDNGRTYTMGSRPDWYRYVWGLLDQNLAEGESKMMLHIPTEQVWTSYHTGVKIGHTISTNLRVVTPHQPPIRGQAPLAWTTYRDGFNKVDLFNRLYYRHPFPHRHMKWTDHIFYVFLKVSLCNAWVLYKSLVPQSKLSKREFMSEVAEGLLNTKYKDE